MNPDNQTQSCDVVIVGGGPAGSTCAWQLRRRGLDVVVMDKAPFPRDKVCAGWITPGVVRALEMDLQAYGAERTLQAISSFRIGVIGGGEQEVRYPETVSYGIRRCEFDDYLLRRADARLLLGQSLKSLEKQGTHWVVNDAVRTPLVVGAGGHFCPVARHLGACSRFPGRTVLAQEMELQLTPEQATACSIRPETPELFFSRDLQGYGWCFRKGGYVNIGLGREDSKHLARHLADFCAFLKARGKIPSTLTGDFNGHAYALYGHAERRLVDDGLLLIGDAVGLAHARSGEGIGPAIESALIASQVIHDAAGDYSSARLAEYPERLQAHFGKPTGQTASLVPAALRRAVGRLLLTCRWFDRHVVLDRWFLQTQRPSLEIGVN